MRPGSLVSRRTSTAQAVAAPEGQGARVAVFATLGPGSRDEARIVSLTARFRPTVWQFDRANKWRSAVRVVARLRRERPDVVVVEGTSIAAGVAVLIGRLAFKVPFVLSSGDAVGPFVRMIAPGLGVFGGMYEVVLCRACAGFIGWTPYLAGRAITLGATRAMTAANWAPTQPVSNGDRESTRRELGIPPDAIVFGLVGSLNWSARAGYCYGLELVRAIARTSRREVHVLLVGDGSGRERLVAEAGPQLGARVHLAGRVSRDELGRYLAVLDVGSLPQSVDRIGAFRYTTKLSEYLAAGVPIVTGQLPLAYDLGGDWLWRLPGDTPWSDAYVNALARLMTELSGAELRARRAAVPRNLPVFDKLLQTRSVGDFLTDILEREADKHSPGSTALRLSKRLGSRLNLRLPVR
jgi:glycosyltransferase involved in cell wall biosynthesis